MSISQADLPIDIHIHKCCVTTLTPKLSEHLQTVTNLLLTHHINNPSRYLSHYLSDPVFLLYYFISLDYPIFEYTSCQDKTTSPEGSTTFCGR